MLAFRPDSKMLAVGSFDTTIRLWRVDTGRNTAVLKGHSFTPISLAFSPDGKTLASGSTRGKIRFWDVATGRNLATIAATAEKGPGVIYLVYDRRGKRLLHCDSNGTVVLWRMPSRKKVATLKGHFATVEVAAFRADEKSVVLVGRGLKTRVRECIQWDLQSGRVTARLPTPII